MASLPLVSELLVAYAMRLISGGTEPALLVGLVGFVVALEPEDVGEA